MLQQGVSRGTIEPYSDDLAYEPTTPWQWATSCLSGTFMQFLQSVFGKPQLTDQGGTTPSNGCVSGGATRHAA